MSSLQIPWGLLNTFSIPILLFVVRNGYSYYRSFRASYQQRKPNIRPAPQEAVYALNILFVIAVVAFVATLPYFAPTNIFQQTNARMQTPTDVIYHRLQLLRQLTPQDEAVRSKITSRDGRLLYFVYGPDVVANCKFCKSAEPWTFGIYALPTLLAPHLVNFLASGIATSVGVSGEYGTRWRTHSVILNGILAALDLWVTFSYDITSNATTRVMTEIDFFFWKMRIFRALAIAISSMTLAFAIWLSSTNRMFVRPLTMSDRLGNLSQAMELSNMRLIGTGNVRNTVVRNPALRNTSARFFQKEATIYEEREVVDAVKVALSHVDMLQLDQAALQKATQIVNGIQFQAAAPQQRRPQ